MAGRLPRNLARYTVLAKLGEGGMGEVYRARDPSLDRDVALKVLPPETASDPERLERFEREAKILAALSHPNIVTIYSVEAAGAVRFLTMELVEGEALSRRIPTGGVTRRQLFDLALPLAEALAAAHEKGIVHRDLKPANIMVAADGRVKVLDFGLAKRRGPPISEVAEDAPTELLTRAGQLVGTVPYMSPEQLTGGAVDQRSDIFSLGVILYELATGERPFRGDTSVALFSAILRDAPGPVAGRRPDLPPGLDRILQRCLEKDPAKRYESAGDLAGDLRATRGEGLAEPGGRHAERARPEGASIAVLPFVSRTADPENEYFSEGLAEDIINALTSIENLRVAARTSAFSFRGERADIRDIGSRLGVGHVLEGSVRRAGGRLRITAQLVEVEHGYQVWSEQYDRLTADVFDIQDEITLAIVAALRVQLLDRQRQEVIKRHTGDVEAYDLYLKGRYFWNKRNPEAFRTAIRHFEAAVEKDPGYALAYAGLADAFALLGDAGHTVIPPGEAFSRAERAVAKALGLDDRLAEAHTSLAHLKMHSFEWPEAEREFRRALELNSNYPTAHHWYAFFFAFQGRFEEAVESMRRALELDPLSLPASTDMGVLHYYAGRYDQAIEQYQKVLELDPGFVRAYVTLGSAYGKKGHYETAVSMFDKALRMSGDRTKVAGLGRIHGLAGRRREALETIGELERLSAERYVSPYAVALIYASLGDRDEAMAWLEKATSMKVSELIYMGVDPYLEPLRGDPRFQRLLAAVGL